MPPEKVSSAAEQLTGHVARVSRLFLAVDGREPAFESILKAFQAAGWPRAASAGGPGGRQSGSAGRPATERVVLGDEVAMAQAGDALSKDPGARLVVLYQSPAVFLAAGLEEEGGDIRLAAWQAEARRLLDTVRRHRRQTILVDGHAALAAPGALAEQIRARLRCDLDVAQLQQATAPDAVTGIARMIADYAVRHDAAASMLAAEWQASSLPLAPPAEAEVAEAIAEWRKGEAGSPAKLRELQEENDLLLAQLHETQEELEPYLLAGRGTVLDPNAAAELKRLRAEVTKTTRQLATRNKQIEEIYQSKSWKLTAPLRKVVDLMSRGAGKR